MDREANLALDESGNIKEWKITYCGWLTSKELLDKRKPFSTAYISAHTAKEAVARLRRELSYAAELKIYGEPTLSLIAPEQYENG